MHECCAHHSRLRGQESTCSWSDGFPFQLIQVDIDIWEASGVRRCTHRSTYVWRPYALLDKDGPECGITLAGQRDYAVYSPPLLAR
jgi:hypothetical protein